MLAAQIPPFIARLQPGHSPVLLVGRTGVGKTAGVIEGCKLAGRECRFIHGATLEGVDVRGIPFPDWENNIARWLAAQFWAVDGHGDQVAFFLDEINRAQPDVQQAMFRVLDRQVGDLHIPDNVLMILAANPPTAANMVNSLSAPFLNRLRIIPVDTNVQSWLPWAASHNIHQDVISFLSSPFGMPYFSTEPSGENTRMENVASPRTWEAVSQTLWERHGGVTIIHRGVEDVHEPGPEFDSDEFDRMRMEEGVRGIIIPEGQSIEMELVAGSVGPDVASKFFTWREIGEKAPEPLDVLEGRAPLPNMSDDPGLAIYTGVAVSMLVYNRGVETHEEGWMTKWVRCTIDWPSEIVAIGFSLLKGMPEADALKCRATSPLGSDQVDIFKWIEKHAGIIT
jgi:hypothetical protein